MRDLLVILAAAAVLGGCVIDDPPSPPKPTPVVANSKNIPQGPGFVNRVWQVSTSSTVEKGQIYIFVSDGTLVISSPHGKPTVGSWKLDKDKLTIVEDVPYQVQIELLTPETFQMKVLNPGEPTEITLTAAPQPAFKT